jgi:hypothetical protein
VQPELLAGSTLSASGSILLGRNEPIPPVQPELLPGFTLSASGSILLGRNEPIPPVQPELLPGSTLSASGSILLGRNEPVPPVQPELLPGYTLTTAGFLLPSRNEPLPPVQPKLLTGYILSSSGTILLGRNEPVPDVRPALLPGFTESASGSVIPGRADDMIPVKPELLPGYTLASSATTIPSRNEPIPDVRPALLAGYTLLSGAVLPGRASDLALVQPALLPGYLLEQASANVIPGRADEIALVRPELLTGYLAPPAGSILAPEPNEAKRIQSVRPQLIPGSPPPTPPPPPPPTFFEQGHGESIIVKQRWKRWNFLNQQRLLEEVRRQRSSVEGLGEFPTSAPLDFVDPDQLETPSEAHYADYAVIPLGSQWVHVVALTSGTVEHVQTKTGALGIVLTSDEGQRFFYAGIGRFSGPNKRRVEEGDLLAISAPRALASVAQDLGGQLSEVVIAPHALAQVYPPLDPTIDEGTKAYAWDLYASETNRDVLFAASRWLETQGFPVAGKMLAARAVALDPRGEAQTKLLPVHVHTAGGGRPGGLTGGQKGFLLGAGFVGLLAFAWHKKR